MGDMRDMRDIHDIFFFLLSLILLNVHRDLPVLGVSIHGYSVLVSHGGRGGDMGNNNIVS